MEIVAFTLVAIALYLVSDRILDAVEVRRGARLQHRGIVFFGILVTLALISFTILERVLSGG